MEQQAETWAAPLNFEEKLKKYLIPPQLYMHLRYKKEMRNVPEIRLLPFLCHPDKASIDVGANKGVYSYAMLKNSGEVHSFEPHPKMYKMMVGFVGDRVKHYQMALSNKSGTAQLHLLKSDHGYSNMGGSLNAQTPRNDKPNAGSIAVDVEAKRLDDCGIKDVGFMKVDVEGFEMEVLEGARDTMAKYRPNLLVEVENLHNRTPLQDRIGFICKEYGYRCFALRRGQLTPFALLDPEVHFVKHRGEKRDYIFNFIFLPE